LAHRERYGIGEAGIKKTQEHGGILSICHIEVTPHAGWYEFSSNCLVVGQSVRGVWLALWDAVVPRAQR